MLENKLIAITSNHTSNNKITLSVAKLIDKSFFL